MRQAPGNGEPDLRAQLGVLIRRKWVILIITIIVVGGTVAYTSTQKPIYTATTEVQLGALSTSASLTGINSPQVLSPSEIQTEIELFHSAPVENAVKAQLHSLPGVSVNEIGTTSDVSVQATSEFPAKAAQIANAYANAFVTVRNVQASQSISTEQAAVEAQISQINAQTQKLQNQINSTPPKQQAAVQASLQPQLDQLSLQEGSLQQSLNYLDIEAGLPNSSASVVSPAVTPMSPTSPKPTRDGLIALIVGLLIGAALAYLIEYLDDTVKSKEDVESITQPLPVLGLIPYMESWKNRAAPNIIAMNSSNTPISEAYRSLRTSIQFMSLDRSMRTIQITSSRTIEGKSTTVANLGVALAESGQNVILVCCDLRLPRLHEFFELSNEVGFTSVILGDTPLADALQPVATSRGSLRILASGPRPPNPSELLAGQKTAEILTELQVLADVVIIDCPPILPVTDSAVLSKRVDATLLVCMAGVITSRELDRAYEILSQVDAPLVGTVLNGASTADGYGGSYGYTYGYGYYDSAPKHSNKSTKKGDGPQSRKLRRRPLARTM